jgi:hypothetical protein
MNNKSLMWFGGALTPIGYIYDLSLFEIGQKKALEHLETFIKISSTSGPIVLQPGSSAGADSPDANGAKSPGRLTRRSDGRVKDNVGGQLTRTRGPSLTRGGSRIHQRTQTPQP